MPLWSIPEIGTGKFLPHSLSLSFSVFSLVCLSVLVVAQSVIFCRYTSLQHHLYRLSEKRPKPFFSAAASRPSLLFPTAATLFSAKQQA